MQLHSHPRCFHRNYVPVSHSVSVSYCHPSNLTGGPLSSPSLWLCQPPPSVQSHCHTRCNCHSVTVLTGIPIVIPVALALSATSPPSDTPVVITVTLSLSAVAFNQSHCNIVLSPSLWLYQPLRLCQRHWHTCHHRPSGSVSYSVCLSRWHIWHHRRHHCHAVSVSVCRPSDLTGMPIA